MSLRFRQGLNPRHAVLVSLRLKPILLLLTLLCLSVYLSYALFIAWFKFEFGRADMELIRQESVATAQATGQLLPPTFSTRPLSHSQQLWVHQALGDLVQKNINIIAVMLIDTNRRVRDYRFAPGATILGQLAATGRFFWYDESTILSTLVREHPTLKSMRVEILNRNGTPAGWLSLIIDRNMSQEAVRLAASRMTRRLALLMVALTLIIALAALIIRRQQRLTQNLIRQRNEAERLAYVGALAAGLAHEIRNPLNALAMQLELLEEDVLDDSPQMVTPRIQRIRKGLGNVERTVHDFLNYATPIRQQPSLVDLTEVVEPVCVEIRAHPEQLPVELECLVVPGLRAWCDPHALRQILSNLLHNGLQAQHRGPFPRRLRVEAARNGPWIDLLVDDAGPGISGEARDKVFDCFFTTHSEGTGLGLPIARRLAEMNGGALELMPEPSPLGGARFCLHLPARPSRRGLDSTWP